MHNSTMSLLLRLANSRNTKKELLVILLTLIFNPFIHGGFTWGWFFWEVRADDSWDFGSCVSSMESGVINMPFSTNWEVTLVG